MGGRSGQGVIRNAAPAYNSNVTESEFKDALSTRGVSDYLIEQKLKKSMQIQSADQIEKSKEVIDFDKKEKTLIKGDREFKVKSVAAYTKDGKFLAATVYFGGRTEIYNTQSQYDAFLKQIE